VKGLAARAVVDERSIKIFEFSNNSLRNEGLVPRGADATLSSGSERDQKRT
jgi:hypothetical protein